jgi:cation-transporting ATPase E
VEGDLLVIRAGDQIPVDGAIANDGHMEVDESALTGESDLVQKGPGDSLLSGTFAVSGEAQVMAAKVGEGSFANKLTKNARVFATQTTPLQASVNLLLRVLLVIVLFFVFLATLALFLLDTPFDSWLAAIAVITGSVSAGLLTLITLNYSWGAVRIGQKGGLVQQINAVESLCNVSVLCTDKTGTLTANRMRLDGTHPVGISKEEFDRLLADFAASATTVNKTTEAVRAGLQGTVRPVRDEVPFNSARKWSALAFDDAGDGSRQPLMGAYVLGALEMVEDVMPVDAANRQLVTSLSETGLRVLVFGRNETTTTLHDAAGEPILPPLTLLGAVALGDELRPHLSETIDAFTRQGVKLKVISGDNPTTVAALARQAGFPGELKTVSGPELAAMDGAQFAQTAVDATVFGRITPQQKEALVDALKSRGEYVAMIGDGVNDVLSLKKANLGVAMESGSSATRSVAAMVLLGDSFEVMPQAFTEGIRIVNSIQEILKLFMVTVFSLLLLIVATSSLGLGFPFTVLQSTLLSIFTRGIPPLVLGLAATAQRQSRTLLQNLLQFTLPASILIFVFGIFVYAGIYFAVERQLIEADLTQDQVIAIGERNNQDFSNLTPEEFVVQTRQLAAQTALTSFFVFSGILLMVFAQPPVRWLAGGNPYNGGRWMPTIAAALLILVYVLILAIPWTRTFFDLIPLPMPAQLFIVAMTLAWAGVQLLVWRKKTFERFLGIEDGLQHDPAPVAAKGGLPQQAAA